MYATHCSWKPRNSKVSRFCEVAPSEGSKSCHLAVAWLQAMHVKSIGPVLCCVAWSTAAANHNVDNSQCRLTQWWIARNSPDSEIVRWNDLHLNQENILNVHLHAYYYKGANCLQWWDHAPKMRDNCYGDEITQWSQVWNCWSRFDHVSKQPLPEHCHSCVWRTCVKWTTAKLMLWYQWHGLQLWCVAYVCGCRLCVAAFTYIGLHVCLVVKNMFDSSWSVGPSGRIFSLSSSNRFTFSGDSPCKHNNL